MSATARSRRRVGLFAVSALVAIVGGLGIAEATTATPGQVPSHQHTEQHGEHEH
ncbi:MAG: hypothetical protein ABIQ09_01000 [Jatrophihabitantaceae bacterium]